MSDLLGAICSQRPLDFVVLGTSDEPNVQRQRNGFAPVEGTMYLAVNSNEEIFSRPIVQRGGDVRYVVEPSPGGVSFYFGRTIAGVCLLLPGQIATGSLEAQSLGIYAVFRREAQKRFEKIKSYYVGPEAASLLDKGFRLAQTEKSTAEYDLVR